MREINEKAKELGELIKESEQFKRMQLAELAVNSNTALQDQFKEFNALRERMMGLMDKGIDDKTIIDPLNLQIKDLYEKVMQSDLMKEYNEARKDFDSMLQNVNNIMMFYITGELPGCSESDCASCGGGCH